MRQDMRSSEWLVDVDERKFDGAVFLIDIVEPAMKFELVYIEGLVSIKKRTDPIRPAICCVALSRIT